MDRLQEPAIKAQLIDYLSSFDLFKGNESEGLGYVRNSIERFLITVQMVPPATHQGARLLELGSNPYFISLLLKKFHQYDLVLTNYFGPEQPDEGEQTIRSERYGETHTFRYAHFNSEVAEFPFEDDSFDVVLVAEVLEHLTLNPTHMLNEIHRVLRPGGHVLITTPNMVRLDHLWQLALGRNINDQYSGYGVYGRHNREYSPQEVIRLLEDSGFGVEKVRLANIYPHHPIARILSDVRTHWRDNIFALARAEGAPRYHLGGWLYRSFTTVRRVSSDSVVMGQNDTRHIGTGWYPLEESTPPQRWTQQAAEIFLKARGGEEAVTAIVSSGPPGLGPVQVTLRSGTAAAHFRLADGSWTPLRLPIAPPTAGDEVAVTIEVDQLRCPAEIGFNRDGRRLGVMVRQVSLEAAPLLPANGTHG